MYRSDEQLQEVTDDSRFVSGEAGGKTWNLLRRLTIGKSPHELYQLYRQPEIPPRMYAHFADVTVDGRRWHWALRTPFGSLEWDCVSSEDEPGRCIAWNSVEGSQVPNEGWIRFDPAPKDWGTEVTLYVRFDPPAGPLGDAVAGMMTAVPKIVSDKALRRFKSLAETGEIPTVKGESR